MPLVRFVDEQGEVCWGREHADGAVELVVDGQPTGRAASVARLLAPVAPTNVFCIGRNYPAHVAETGATTPEHPVVFMKPTTAVIGPGEPIRLPACQLHGPEVDYEGELAVVIGRAVRDVSVDEVLGCVLGYTVANDVSARRWQKHAGGGQWVRGKGFDTFCPLGPRLVLASELVDPQALRLRTVLNGQTVQDASTAEMIFSVAQLLAFLSTDTTLLPGTVVLTGTPPGVGFVREPPLFLGPGDEVAVTIDGIGELRNPVHGPS